MDGSLNTGRFPGGLKTLVGLKDLLDLLQQQEERRRPKTASSVFSSEKFYWQQLGRRRRGARGEGCKILLLPGSGPSGNNATAAVTNDKKRRKKKWLLSTISWLKKAFFLIFFSPFFLFSNASLTATEDDEGDQGEISKRISWQETIWSFYHPYTPEHLLLCLQCKKRRPLINLSFIFLLKANPLLVLFWRVKKWNWTAENRWTVFITRTTLVKNRAEAQICD